MIKNSKKGDCSQDGCGATNTACVKRGKELLCLRCAKKSSNNSNIEKLKGRGVINPKGETSDMSKWYGMVADYISENPYCENCGEPVPECFHRHASAHIFPKSLFPSVRTHPSNFLVLGSQCGCHSTFDLSVDRASKMKVWDMAVNRFLKFESSITEQHKYLTTFKNYA